MRSETSGKNLFFLFFQCFFFLLFPKRIFYAHNLNVCDKFTAISKNKILFHCLCGYYFSSTFSPFCSFVFKCFKLDDKRIILRSSNSSRRLKAFTTWPFFFYNFFFFSKSLFGYALHVFETTKLCFTYGSLLISANCF